MDAREMTPAQLRAMADEMEARPAGIDADEHDRRLRAARGDIPDDAHRDSERALEKMREGAAPTSDEPKRPGYMRHVTVDGIAVDVDMRVLRDIETMRVIGRIRKGGDDDAMFESVELFDRLLGDQRERVQSELSDEDGFCDSEAYATFALRVFEVVGAKN